MIHPEEVIAQLARSPAIIRGLLDSVPPKDLQVDEDPDRLRSLTQEAWQRTATHTAHSRYSLFLMCRHMAMHDGPHGYRIEESALGSHWPNER